ncbi:hypothetical protein P7K49_011166 [Saguinus oedipus]|uniref:Uncharacterized protein n=1 Tax=Saguinus oedipus TaxID=9490 RepID=A0ABQ9VQM9_SAGOE|nr:hypothetical protein P7K49_011166 [Saguinus oedipus]
MLGCCRGLEEESGAIPVGLLPEPGKLELALEVCTLERVRTQAGPCGPGIRHWALGSPRDARSHRARDRTCGSPRASQILQGAPAGGGGGSSRPELRPHRLQGCSRQRLGRPLPAKCHRIALSGPGAASETAGHHGRPELDVTKPSLGPSRRRLLPSRIPPAPASAMAPGMSGRGGAALLCLYALLAHGCGRRRRRGTHTPWTRGRHSGLGVLGCSSSYRQPPNPPASPAERTKPGARKGPLRVIKKGSNPRVWGRRDQRDPQDRVPAASRPRLSLRPAGLGAVGIRGAAPPAALLPAAVLGKGSGVTRGSRAASACSPVGGGLGTGTGRGGWRRAEGAGSALSRSPRATRDGLARFGGGTAGIRLETLLEARGADREEDREAGPSARSQRWCFDAPR